MKKLTLLASFAIFLFSSCGEKKSSSKATWPEKERNEYMEQCVNSAQASMGKEKAKTYCSCTLDKMQTKYPKPEDALNINMTDLMDLAKGCL